MRLDIDPDTGHARTPDPVFYTNAAAYVATRERVFGRTWQWLGDLNDATTPPRDAGAGSGLDRVEAEDEAIVEAVQRGVSSCLYRGGRYSPTRERGVHHFHRLLAGFLEGEHP